MKKIASFFGTLLSIALIIIFTWVSIKAGVESSTADITSLSTSLLVIIILFIPVVFISLAINLYSISAYENKRLFRIILLILSIVAYVSMLIVTCVINEWNIFDLLNYFLNFLFNYSLQK